METCYHLRRAVALGLALVVVACAAPAAAQYMYLDANGDGVHTSADLMPAEGTVTFDVWLKTNENRDGSTAVCAQDPSAELTINSYSFILRATNGSVTWGGFVNRVEAFTIAFGADSTSLEYWNGRASGTILPAGAYRLASLQATVEAGTPSIDIASTFSLDARVITQFGCRCDATDGDNTMKLGIDWNDRDGLPFDGVTNFSPVLAQPAPMAVTEGQVAERELQASDAEGEPITFHAVSPPGFMTVTTISSGPGTATGKVRLAPGYSDAGNRNVAIRADDGVGYDEKFLWISVVNGNRLPIIDPIADMTVAPGDSATQDVTASDPDGDAIHFSKGAGPAWVGVITTGATSARIVLTPPETVGGLFTVTLNALDHASTAQASFDVVVTGPTHAPTFLWAASGVFPPLEVVEGEVGYYSVYATDADGLETLRFSMQEGPPFVEVWEGSALFDYASTYIWVRPRPGDRGDYAAVIAVTDGTSTTTAILPIRVTNGYEGDTSLQIFGAAGNPLLDGGAHRATDWHLGAEVDGVDSLGIGYWMPDTTDIELVPRRRGAEWCAKGWRGLVRLRAPVGDSLRAGVYEGAVRDADASHPGLDITIGCERAASVSGRFELKELDVRYGHIYSAWVTFEATVNGSPAPIRGELRYKVRSVPVTVHAPGRLQAGVGDDVTIVVTAADSARGTVALQADGPPGSVFTPGAIANSGIFTWRPTFEQVGARRVVFRGSNPAGDTASAFCDVIVAPRNAVSAVLDANETELFVSNRGAFAYDLRDSSDGLAFRQYGDSRMAGSSAGLWVAALVDGSPRVAIGGTTPEFTPGPAPGGQAQPFDPRYKNYKVVRGRTDAADWREWPASQGAPTDGTGQPAVLGDVTTWSVYNDCDPASHQAPNGGTAPLGLEVRQSSWAYQHDGPLGRTVYLRFHLRNTGSHHLSSAYASVWVDPYAERKFWPDYNLPPVVQPLNDLIGCDSTRALAYAYSSTNDQFYSTPAVGVTLLRGAVRNPSSHDSVSLGVTSIRRLAGTPGSAPATYNVMRGLHEDGAPLLDPSGQPTRFEVSGDPVAGSGWVDSLAAAGTRKLFVLSTGPFDMDPGQEQTIEAAVVIGSAGDRIASITDLRSSVDVVRGASPIANHPPSLDYGLRAYLYDEGYVVTQDFRGFAVEPDGDRLVFTAPQLPTGSVLTGEGEFRWPVGYDQAGIHLAHVIATDGFGAWDSMTIGFTIRNVNRAPIARSGGPYQGAAGTPIEFDASASNDPDAEPWFASWTFGDGSTAEGAHASHAYAVPGSYTVALLVSDQFFADRDTTVALVATPITARVFVSGAGGVVRLGSPAPTLALSLEIEGGGVSLDDLHAASFALESHGTGTVSSIRAVDSETRVGADSDGNGQPELTLVFRKADLRALFFDLAEGRSTTPAVLTGVVGKNTAFAATVELTIETTHKPLTVVLAPNPINPRGILTFTTSRAGRVRVSLFDARGRLVRHLYEAESAPAGYHDVPIDGKDRGGRPLASGLYFYRIDAAEGSTSGRLTILK